MSAAQIEQRGAGQGVDQNIQIATLSVGAMHERNRIRVDWPRENAEWPRARRHDLAPGLQKVS
jgi:hypothetical protein